MGFIMKLILGFLAVNLVIFFAPGIPPYLPFEAYTVVPPRPLEGKLSPNSILDKAEAMELDREIRAPDSIAIRGDELYAGIMGGEIIRIKDGKVTTVAKFGTGNCEGEWDYANCGRVAGIRFAPDGKLIACDFALGLYRVDVDKGTFEQLVSKSDKIEGQTPAFPDDVDVAKDGTIYWADGSTIGDSMNFILELFSSPTGRLIKYDPKTKKNTVLVSNLHFAGGVQLSKDEDFVLVSDSVKGRVMKYHLKGAKKGQTEVFIDGLPGIPDNIRSNGKDGFYFPLPMPRIDSEFSLPDTLGPLPLVRRFLMRIRFLIVESLCVIESFYPGPILREWIAYARHLGPAMDIDKLPLKATVVEVNGNGEIVRSFQNEKGPIKCTSQLTAGKDYSYLGTFGMRKMYRIKNEYLS